MPKQNEIELGVQSQLLNSHPIYLKAIKQIRQEIFDKWTNSEFSDTENREQLYKMKIGVELISSKLDKFILDTENEITLKNNIDEQETWK